MKIERVQIFSRKRKKNETNKTQ